MKNAKCVFGIIVIGFCLLFISTYVSAADSAQPPWRTTVWPALSSTQWYWYEPQTNLTVEQIEAIFKEVAATNILLIDYRYPNSEISVKNAQLEIKKPKKVKKADKGSLNPGQVAIKMDTYWTTNGSVSGDGSAYSYSIPLNAIQTMQLRYSTRLNNKWCLSMGDGVSDNTVYAFFFKDDENFARRFGNAVASIFAQNGLILHLPKLGLTYVDLTPAQAEALGKTRIDNVLVTLVAIDGPADKANIQPLDVITEVNGVKVRNYSHFSSLVEGIASDTRVALTCLRRTEIEDKGQKQFDWKPIVIEVIAK